MREEPRGRDEDVAGVVEHLARVRAADPEVPPPLGLVEPGVFDTVVELHVPVEVVLGHRPLEVCQHLFAAGVERAPGRVWLERNCKSPHEICFSYGGSQIIIQEMVRLGRR